MKLVGFLLGTIYILSALAIIKATFLIMKVSIILASTENYIASSGFMIAGILSAHLAIQWMDKAFGIRKFGFWNEVKKK